MTRWHVLRMTRQGQQRAGSKSAWIVVDGSACVLRRMSSSTRLEVCMGMGKTGSGIPKWVHKRCSGVKGSMSKVAGSFICRGCLNPVTGAGRTSVDVGAGAGLELVGDFWEWE